MNELALFAGAGGGLLGTHLLGFQPVCAVEFNAYARSILLARQNDGTLPPFPIWDDVRTFDGKEWNGVVDLVSGGFPCQDISAAGKGAGLDGERSGLWAEMARIIREVQPRFVFVENSPMLTSRGLGRVLGDMAEMGFDAEWGVISAADTGAPHLRERIWIVADARSGRRNREESGEMEQPRRAQVIGGSEAMAHSDSLRELQPKRHEQEFWRWSGNSGTQVANANREREREQRIFPELLGSQVWMQQGKRPLGSRGDGFGRWPTEPGLGRVAHGMAHRVDRIKALGNGQVPRVAAAAFLELSRRAASRLTQEQQEKT